MFHEKVLFMSFTDPFNRVGRKREMEYLAFQDQLKKAGLDTEQKVKTMLKKSRARMLGFGAIVVVVTLLVSLIWPNLMAMAIVLGSLTLLWIVTIIARGQRMMKQFVQREFTSKR